MTKNRFKTALLAGSLAAVVAAGLIGFLSFYAPESIVFSDFWPTIAFVFVGFGVLSWMSPTISRWAAWPHRVLYRLTGRSGLPLPENSDNWNWRDALLLRRIEPNEADK